MSGQTSDYSNTYLTNDIKANISMFKKIFSKDIILRVKKVTVRNYESFDCALLYLDGMVNVQLLNDSVVRPMMTVNVENVGDSILTYLAQQILFASETKRDNCVANILQSILYGDTLLLIDGSADALTINTKGWKTRGISEPSDEKILQGPREGFEEAALLNLAMIRRKLLTPDLAIESLRIGRRSDTQVFICYLDTLADKKTVAELKKRIKSIDIDGILDSNYITEQIRDNKNSLFKTSGTTERPDIVAARLLEGRIALVVDGTPVVATIPYLFSENFQSDEDYYLNYMVSSIGRILRYVCFFLAISIPAIFIAITTFHKELLPTSLALSIAKLRGGVPFSALTECLVLIFVFEILKETGVRIPQSLGHALSIVGGLVVGQAAVEAKIISTPMLIIIAIAGIAGLMIPRLKGAVFYLRIILVLLSALFGLYGYFAGVTVLMVRILTLSSFGTDYTVSLRRADFQSMKDTVWRAPWFIMKNRPLFNKNIIRMGSKRNND